MSACMMTMQWCIIICGRSWPCMPRCSAPLSSVASGSVAVPTHVALSSTVVYISTRSDVLTRTLAGCFKFLPSTSQYRVAELDCVVGAEPFLLVPEQFGRTS